MKKSVCLLSLVILGGLSSCMKILDTKPTDVQSVTDYYKTEKELDNALTGIYDALGKEQPGYLITLFSTVDEMFTSNVTGLTIFDYDPGLLTVYTVWQRFYQGIERANMLLANIDKPQIDEDRRKVIKGEAKFLRAYLYFMLVQNFGDVPLKLKPTASVDDIYYERTPADEVYTFIVKEMMEAESLVKPITAYSYGGRVTQSAVRGMLARVNLYWAGFPTNKPDKYKDALAWAKKVIDSGYHHLNPDYAQVFINLIQNKYETKESIWELEFYTT
ncbi:MAG TPA: RagB/SusD family nutrient uptake outer membrane protein, partial [Chitinophaga sp.]|uniref:RagB/SusD family nutrient uptake outer membrane protein n=1 Tax=Chitinophaga sp. TaxID=1869181 RepID=UPI002BB191D6